MNLPRTADPVAPSLARYRLRLRVGHIPRRHVVETRDLGRTQRRVRVCGVRDPTGAGERESGQRTREDEEQRSNMRA